MLLMFRWCTRTADREISCSRELEVVIAMLRESGDGLAAEFILRKFRKPTVNTKCDKR